MGNIIGVFPDKEAADVAFFNLTKAGYRSQDVSVILKEELILNKEQGQKGGIASTYFSVTNTVNGAVKGISRIASGLSAIFIPGLGAVIIAGPLASVLGVTRATAVTISGVITGVLSGGLAAGLIELGFKKGNANFYEKLVNKGGVVVCVPVIKDYSPDQIRQIFMENGGSYIKELGTKRYK